MTDQVTMLVSRRTFDDIERRLPDGHDVEPDGETIDMHGLLVKVAPGSVVDLDLARRTELATRRNVVEYFLLATATDTVSGFELKWRNQAELETMLTDFFGMGSVEAGELSGGGSVGSPLDRLLTALEPLVVALAADDEAAEVELSDEQHELLEAWRELGKANNPEKLEASDFIQWLGSLRSADDRWKSGADSESFDLDVLSRLARRFAISRGRQG